MSNIKKAVVTWIDRPTGKKLQQVEKDLDSAACLAMFLVARNNPYVKVVATSLNNEQRLSYLYDESIARA